MKAVTTLLLILILRSGACQGAVINNEDVADKGTEDVRSVSNNELQVEHNWECSLDSRLKDKQLMKTIEMIKHGEKTSSEPQQKTKNTVLVLGDAGVGKTTFVQYMAGNNSELISKETDGESKFTGNYVIEDGKRIGSSATDSMTLYPELVEYTDGSAFCDTPGFSDTRSPMHEIVSTYAMKKYVSNIENVKIVLLVNYNSLLYGVDKRDFMDLLRNLNKFLINPDKYTDNMALVATKVPESIRRIKNEVVEIPDENLIAGIAEFLFKVKISLTEKLSKSEDPNETKFLKNAIKITESLAKCDENGSFSKINLFHRPSQPGPLQDMENMQKWKKSLHETVYESIGYTKLNSEDFGYALSDRAKNYLDCLLRQVGEKIKGLSQGIFQNIHEYYRLKISNYSCLYSLGNELETTDKELEDLKNKLDLSNEYSDYIAHLKQYIKEHTIAIEKTDDDTVSQVYTYINELRKFCNTEYILVPATWTLTMKPIIDYIKHERSWYRFLIQIFELMSTFQVQKSKIEYLGMFVERNNQVAIKNSLLKVILGELSQYDTHQKTIEYVNGLSFDNSRLEELYSIVSFCLKEPVNATCSNEGKLVVTGNYIRVSDINMEYCNNTVRKVNVFAAKTVFIDEDIVSDAFSGIDMMIAAPKWEIIGSRRIALDGKDGKPHGKEKAEDGWLYGMPGVPGYPGLPGNNGGNFVGFGLEFINGALLKVTANGGDGGTGQNGGKGMDGEAGRDGCERIFSPIEVTKGERTEIVKFNSDAGPFNKTFYAGFESLSEAVYFTDTRLPSNGYSRSRPWEHELTTPQPQYYSKVSPSFKYFENGECASKFSLVIREGLQGETGGDGGNGGAGGFGGNEGSATIVDYGRSPGISVEIKPGKTGKDGTGGQGGEAGIYGNSIICYNLLLNKLPPPHYYEKTVTQNYWRCQNFTNSLIEKLRPVSSNPGLSGFVRDGIQPPSERKSYDYSLDVLNYITLIEENKDNNLISHLLSEFQEKVLKKKLQSMKAGVIWKFVFNDSMNITSLLHL